MLIYYVILELFNCCVGQLKMQNDCKSALHHHVSQCLLSLDLLEKANVMILITMHGRNYGSYGKL